MGCSIAVAGSKDCCNISGWNPLSNCSSKEKQLAKDKKKGVVINNGSYCKNKVLGVCTSHEHPACVYPSVIVQDIVEQGVIGQLYNGDPSQFYGGAQSTNCRGITPKELQKIDMSKINFKNIIPGIKKHMNIPTSGGNQSKASQRAKCIETGQCKNNGGSN